MVRNKSKGCLHNAYNRFFVVNRVQDLGEIVAINFNRPGVWSSEAVNRLRIIRGGEMSAAVDGPEGGCEGSLTERL
jgi:hypothetical protein